MAVATKLEDPVYVTVSGLDAGHSRFPLDWFPLDSGHFQAQTT